MNAREELKAHIAACILSGKMTVTEGAERLGLSERQVKRLKRRVKENGAGSIIHRNCGRQPKHTAKPEKRARILEIKSMYIYGAMNFLHFQELLERKNGIKISYSALSKLLKAEGYTSPQKRRTRKVRHPRRARKEYFGEMLQIDASTHQWFKMTTGTTRYTVL